jgi:DNA-binding beta-propeller fold protein YncE
LSYRLVEGWPQLPVGAKWGQVPNLTIDREGNIYAFHRAEPPVLKFDPSGKLLTSWGQGLFDRAHGFRIDPQGFIWATDQRGHQLFKFSPDGKVLMTLGSKGAAGEGPDTFNGPSDVAVAPNGDFFVADGHGNSRVVKFSKDGRFIKAWGKRGDGPGDFNVPHTLAFDSRSRLLVGDRSNRRIQVFDQDGKFLAQYTGFGSPSGIYITPDDTIYVADYNDKRGITIGRASDGTVLGFIEGTAPEGVAVDAAGNVYAGEVGGQSVKKFELVR